MLFFEPAFVNSGEVKQEETVETPLCVSVFSVVKLLMKWPHEKRA